MGCSILGKDEERSAEKAGEMLLSGCVGVIPCDTIYGLSGKVSAEIGERLYGIKRRPESKSFITLMTPDDVRASSLKVPEDILRRWPAPLTAIVIDEESGKTVAVRVPADEYIQAVMKVSGPVYSTSVNFSGEKSLLTFDDIFPVFSDLVDFIVKDPSVQGGIASTLIDATVTPYRILRQGAYII